MGPWPGRGPFNYLPPWRRPGWVFGFGGGFGRGFGRWGNPYVCARFPWLPRWWWAYLGYGYRYSYPRYDLGYPYTMHPYSGHPAWRGYPTHGYDPGYGYPHMYPWGPYGAAAYPYAEYPQYPPYPRYC